MAEHRKQALVTGANRGIGRAIALALQEQGYSVTATGRDAAALNELAQQGLTPLALDMTDAAAIPRALAGLAPDVLVNNAGVMPPLGNFCDMAVADMQAALTVNLSAVLAVTHALAPAMRSRGSGHIVFTGSTAGHAPFPNMAVYCATKAAISGFAQSLRLDMAPAGVRVTEIVAGRVETELYSSILPQAARQAMYAGQSAVQPQDVAHMVVAVLAMPPYVDVSRFDIVPTHQATSTGSRGK